MVEVLNLNILLDLNGNCKISHLDFNSKIQFCRGARYDLPNLGYLIYQMLTGKLIHLISYSGDQNDRIIFKNDNKLYRKNDLIEELALISNPENKQIIEFVSKMTECHLFHSRIEDLIPDTLAAKNDSCFKDIDWINLETGKLKPPFVIPNKVNIFKLKIKLLNKSKLMI